MNNYDNRPVIIIGAGGHAKVVAESLLERNKKIIAFVDNDAIKVGQKILGIEILDEKNFFENLNPKKFILANGIGSIKDLSTRYMVYKNFKDKGYSFISVTHPSAIISKFAILQEGAQIMAGAIVQTGCNIGENTIINTGSIIDHDCTIGANVHIASGSVLSGNVTIGKNTHIGTGSSIIQGIEIGENSFVAAGSVIFKSLGKNSKFIKGK